MKLSGQVGIEIYVCCQGEICVYLVWLRQDEEDEVWL